MKKYIILFFLQIFVLQTYAQFNDPLFNLSVSKSTRLKKEKIIVDSLTTLWYNTLQEKTLNEYVLPNDTMPVFDDVEPKAEYEGGMYQLIDYLERNKPSKNDSIQASGLNIVKFIISDRGDVLAPQIVYSDCDACVPFTIKIFNDMPRWIPAKHYGIPVYTYYSIPVFY